jgi:hypothetical protein
MREPAYPAVWLQLTAEFALFRASIEQFTARHILVFDPFLDPID